MPTRSPDEIRNSIERTRHDLAVSVEDLRTKVQHLTDWRRQVREHRTAVIVGTALVGFAVGGGIAAMFGRRRRRS
jgi:50S ribosomal subunit-associated GTPase HflX